MKGDEHTDGRVRVTTKLAVALRSFGVRTERIDEPGRWRGFYLVSESAMRLWELRARVLHLEAFRHVLWNVALARADLDETWARAVVVAFECDFASASALLPQKPQPAREAEDEVTSLVDALHKALARAR